MEAIWPGSGSAVSGSTPFGLYDNDSEFQTEAPKSVSYTHLTLPTTPYV